MSIVTVRPVNKNSKYAFGYGIHPGIKFGILILINLLAFSKALSWYRWILLPIEVLLGYLIHLPWRDLRGLLRALALNFLGLFLLFLLAERSWSVALTLFLDYAFTIVIMFLASFLFVKTTPPHELLRFFQMLHVPQSFSVALMVAISFLPILTEKIREIIRYQQARGYRFNFFNLIPLIIPGILSVLDLAINLTLSMESRGFEF